MSLNTVVVQCCFTETAHNSFLYHKTELHKPFFICSTKKVHGAVFFVNFMKKFQQLPPFGVSYKSWVFKNSHFNFKLI